MENCFTTLKYTIWVGLDTQGNEHALTERGNKGIGYKKSLGLTFSIAILLQRTFQAGKKGPLINDITFGFINRADPLPPPPSRKSDRNRSLLVIVCDGPNRYILDIKNGKVFKGFCVKRMI